MIMTMLRNVWVIVFLALAAAVLAQSAATFVRAGEGESSLPFPTRTEREPARQIAVSGFEVGFVDARFDGLRLAVSVQISGRPELGDSLAFGPGPSLTLGNGTTVGLSAGTSDGRRHTLYFDLAGGETVAQGDKLVLNITSVLPIGADPRSFTPEPFPALLLVEVAEAVAPKVVALDHQAALGDFEVVLDFAMVTEHGTRVVGRVEGPADKQHGVTLRATTLSNGTGVEIPATRVREGHGQGGNVFMLDFEVAPGDAESLHLRALAPTQSSGPKSPVAEPVAIVLDLER